MNKWNQIHLLPCAAALLSLSCVAHAGQNWELGVSGGYGVSRDARVSNASGDVAAGVAPGPVFSVYAGNQVRSWLSGEARYSYRMGDLRLSGGGSEARFDAESHSLQYDVLFHGRRSLGVQPFVAAGAGVRIYRGTGKESRDQSLNRYAILTKTSEVRPLLSVGAGIRITVSRLLSVRVEVRDYITPFPHEVIAPLPSSKSSGWLHDFTPTIGLGFTF